MKVGNVSQTVLKRSVLKQLHTKRKEILTDLSVEEMCTAVQIRDTEDVVFASAVVSGNSKKYRGICDHACRVGSGDKGGFGNLVFRYR